MTSISEYENMLTEYEEQIFLFAPRHLNVLKEEMIGKAQQMRGDGELQGAWRSLSQPNWLAEVAARALNIGDITEHLKQQGPRWADGKKRLPLYEQIRRTIADRLHPQVENALLNASVDVAKLRKESDDEEWQPTPDQVSTAQLDLARDFINALVTWRRIDEVNPKDKEGDR